MAKLVSKTYGDALFELAVEENKTEPLLEETTELISIINGNKDFEQFMNHPKIPREEKIKVVKNVFSDRLSNELLGFLVTVIEKDRYAEIIEILLYVVGHIKEYNHIGTAYITTAIPLKDSEQEEIRNRLLATTQYEKMECHFNVDSSLIAGMVIQMGDRVVDSSIRTKLEKLQRELLAIQL